MLQWTALALVVSTLLYFWIERREGGDHHHASNPLEEGPGDFALLARNPYLRLLCLLLLLLNVVNTTGEYILGRSIVEHAQQLAKAAPSFNRDS